MDAVRTAQSFVDDACGSSASCYRSAGRGRRPALLQGVYSFKFISSTFLGQDHNGQVYLDDKNGFAYGLNENTGNQVWARQIGSEFTTPRDISTQAVSASGVLYVGSQDTNLYALNALTGAVLWKTPTGGGIDSSPAIANGVVYFASFDSKIYAVDATSGSVLWSYLTKNLSFSSPIIVNGWLYCGSTDGKIYAFSL